MTGAGGGAAAPPGPQTQVSEATLTATAPGAAPDATGDDRAALDAIFTAPPFTQALVAVRVDRLRDGRTLYSRNAGVLAMPASNMKIVTMAAAAERLGWDFQFETTLETAGPIEGSSLRGDLIVTGTGDPSIGAQDLKGSALFDAWAMALREAGIRRIDGRLIGDDGAFDDAGLGAGWAWDYLAAGYAAPSGALSYNENVAVLRIGPGPSLGSPAAITIGPPGHGLELVNRVTTTEAGAGAAITLARLPGSGMLSVTGRVPLASASFVRTASVDNPTRFFTSALEAALQEHGISVAMGPADIDDLPARPATGARRVIARHRSAPLSSLIGYAMKVSENFYAENLLKAMGAAAGGIGSADSGRQAVRETLAAWDQAADALVMRDGSGLSRYNYVTADLIVGVLTHVWRDERLRGPLLAGFPVGGRDGTLQARMTQPELDRRVQAKTGTIDNVRALSGYLETRSGDKLAFAMIANHFTAPAAQVDAAIDRALIQLVSR